MKKNGKKYKILRDEMLDYIKNNNLKPNDKLPTVREIIKNFDFSYATVHRTLIEMENEGIITKRQGKGLYVNRIEPQFSSKQVALIIPGHFSSHKIFIDVLTGVRAALEKAKIGLLISISNMSHEKEKETIDKLISRHIDGMIIFLEDNYRNDYSHIVELKERNFPFVLIDRYIPELETDYVVINNKDAMLRICSYLKYSRSCDKIFFIPEYESSMNISSSEEKIISFENAIKMLYGNDSGTIMQLDDLVDNIENLSKSYNNIGISMNHDAMVTELLKCLHEKKIEMPANCHIFGYNNSFETPICPTVEQFNDQVGFKAAEILIDKMNNPNNKIVQIKIEPKLLIPDANGNYTLEN
ncbi:MAG: GntR family transcriptional regulator [Bacteroidetes bacterium]|nr:GntR family transcriptional regulator [Bacteroidota bacterium]